ncbi:MAG: PilZ domain-containing protein [Bdellovibrionia bacterium]
MALKKTKENEFAIRVVAALSLAEDHWLSVQNDPPKNVMGKWLVVLMGPSPKVGQWVLMSGTAQSLESLWRWDVRKTKTNPGSWLFYGRRPEYRDGRWAFVSERPELFYAHEGKVQGKRITTSNNGDLIIADNSENSYKALAAFNEKQINKVLVSIPGEDKPFKQDDSLGTVRVEGDPSDAFQDIVLDGALAAQFKERLNKKISESADSGGNPLFHSVDETNEKNELLEQGSLTRAKTEIWSKDRKHRVDAQMIALSTKQNMLTTAVAGGQVQPFIDILRRLNDVTCLFSVNLQQVQLFFVSSLVKFNRNAFQFEVPDKLFEVQRRFSLRYGYGADSDVKVEFDHPRSSSARATHKLTDVSAGGLGFVADVADKELYAPGQDLNRVVFKVGSREVIVAAQVRHCTVAELNGQPAYLKVGLSFKKLKPRDANHINMFVYEQSLKFLSGLRS